MKQRIAFCSAIVLLLAVGIYIMGGLVVPAPVDYSSDELQICQKELTRALDSEQWAEYDIMLIYMDPEHHGVVVEGIGWDREKKAALRALVSSPEMLLFVEHTTVWFTGTPVDVMQDQYGNWDVLIRVTAASDGEKVDEERNLLYGSYDDLTSLTIGVETSEALLSYETITLICADIALTSYPPSFSGIDIIAGPMQ